MVRTFDHVMSCKASHDWNEDVYVNEGPLLAKRLGYRFMKSQGFLGGSLIQRSTLPSLAAQGIGAGLHSMATHVDLLKLVYNATNPSGRHHRALE